VDRKGFDGYTATGSLRNPKTKLRSAAPMLFNRRKVLKHDASPTSRPLVRIKLPTEALRKGMHVVELDRPWTEVPVLFQHFVIESDQHLQTLRQYCKWALVEVEQQYVTENRDYLQALESRRFEPLPERHSLIRELPRAERGYQKAKTFITGLLHDIERDNAIHIDEAVPIIQNCVTSILANANAMFWLSRIRHEDSYTAEHCLRVALMAIAFGRFLGMDKAAMETLGLCGLLHDIGKVKVPSEVLNKPGRLNPEEWGQMTRHPELGSTMLRQHHQLDPIVADAALSHHERLDGRGYPNRAGESQISHFARIIAIVDAYDAITSDRCYRRGRSPAEALRILFRERGKHFDIDLTEAFIRMVGIYPPGSLVEMTNGEVGIVLSTNPNHRLRPKVELLLAPDKQPRASLIINLEEEPVDDDGNPYAIRQAVPDEAYGFNLEARISEEIRAFREQTKD